MDVSKGDLASENRKIGGDRTSWKGIEMAAIAITMSEKMLICTS